MEFLSQPIKKRFMVILHVIKLAKRKVLFVTLPGLQAGIKFFYQVIPACNPV